MDLSVVIPALDEEASLPVLLPRLHQTLRRLGLVYEIFVVDGGSKDRTIEAAKAAGAQVLEQREGFAGALQAGFAAAAGDYILAMDADGSHPPDFIPRLWERREGKDLVIASRFVRGGSADLIWSRLLLSRLLNRVFRAVLSFPVRDSSSGFRLYRASAVKPLRLESRDFAAQQEILAVIRGRGGGVEEIAFHYDARIGGRSKAKVIPLALSYLRLLLAPKT